MPRPVRRRHQRHGCPAPVDPRGADRDRGGHAAHEQDPLARSRELHGLHRGGRDRAVHRRGARESTGSLMGHEPDSLEFSTLGGGSRTNASGMKKNRYGNIEDLVLDMQVVTAHGVVERPHVAPRESVGANPKNCMFGSEGTMESSPAPSSSCSPCPRSSATAASSSPTSRAGSRSSTTCRAPARCPRACVSWTTRSSTSVRRSSRRSSGCSPG